MRIQLWSYNYEPEPQGIAPLSAVVARALRERGHHVLVVAAHPHYPRPMWGRRTRPYRELRDGVPVLRLPLWIGRETPLGRIRQDLTYTAAHFAASSVLPPADAVVAVSPSFPALAVPMVVSRLRRIPWVLWLQDIVTDAATSTGLITSEPLLRAARHFEQATYASASRIVVISDTFRQNLLAKGVPDSKIVRIYNPMTGAAEAPGERNGRRASPPCILAMGNIGHSQGLDRIVAAFEASGELRKMGAKFVIAGDGVQAAAVHATIRGSRVRMLGVLGREALAQQLRGASLGVVSQRADVSEFNLPSKLMNYMSAAVPVLASVRPDSETARIVARSQAGWVTDAASPDEFACRAAEVIADSRALGRAGAAGHAFAGTNFAPQVVAERFDAVLRSLISPEG